MWLEDIANYVRELNVTGIGQNVFIYTLKAKQSGLLFTTHSAGVLCRPEIPNYYKGSMQMIVRSPDLQTTVNQAITVTKMLDSHHLTNLGQSSIIKLPTCIMNYINMRNYPVAYSRSDGDFYEASVNFDVCFVDISA